MHDEIWRLKQVICETRIEIWYEHVLTYCSNYLICVNFSNNFMFMYAESSHVYRVLKNNLSFVLLSMIRPIFSHIKRCSYEILQTILSFIVSFWWDRVVITNFRNLYVPLSWRFDTFALHASDCIFDYGSQNTCYDCSATEYSITGVNGNDHQRSVQNEFPVSQ